MLCEPAIQSWRKLADEYDAAQERGEVRWLMSAPLPSGKRLELKDDGLTQKQIHEAQLRAGRGDKLMTF